MKNIVLLLALCLAFLSCKNETKATEEIAEAIAQDIAYASFGDKIEPTNVLPQPQVLEAYKNLKAGDTLTTKIAGKIIEVCSKKGCWMTLNLDENHEVMVKFKDYGFFMPLNAEGDVIINGKAFVTETSIDELRHYAEDAGKSEDEIAAITDSKFEYRFEADGVLLKQ